ncbi:MAG: DinB family protein [Pirellulales bacterium]
MLTLAAKLNPFQRRYCRNLVADVDDHEMAVQPFAGANHPAWILGHLVMAADAGLKFLGHPPTATEDYETLFGRGSQPSSDRSLYPTKAELLAAVDKAYDQLLQAGQAATPEQLAAPHGNNMLAKALPTVGELLGMLLTTHVAQHLGQLSAWRRATGRPAMF